MSKENGDIVRLDVCPVLASGGSPLGPILDAVEALEKGQSLLLIAPFEPHPLYMMLADKGYTHSSTPKDGGLWEILFSPVD